MPRWSQTNSNQSQLGQRHGPQVLAKCAPLDEVGGKVRLKNASAREAAFLVEVL